MGREDTSTGMAGNDGHCVGEIKKIAESIVTKKKKGCGALCGFFTKPKRETEKGAKEKRNTAYPWRAQELHSAGGGWS